jgi:nucleotidyltransferase substrate binding protein (TIGR01987 family)
MDLNKERLLHKYKSAMKAFATLEEASGDIISAKDFAACEHKDPEKVYKIYRDSLIQRFEYTFDATWKYVAEFLAADGRIIENPSPKAVFRECLKAKILSEKEVRLAITMVDHRNLTTHAYNEAVVEEIIEHMQQYITLVQHLLQRTHME